MLEPAFNKDPAPVRLPLSRSSPHRAAAHNHPPKPVQGRYKDPLSVRAILFICLTWSLLASCHGSASNASDAATDAETSTAEASLPTVEVDRKAYPRVVNTTGPEGALFYAGWGEGCHLAKTARPEQIPDLNATEPTACPSALRDPAWNRCEGGVIFSSADGKKCLCATAATGGKKPVAMEVPCPGTAPLP
jgi:hypothetical protein